jgi:hypothetical protein
MMARSGVWSGGSSSIGSNGVELRGMVKARWENRSWSVCIMTMSAARVAIQWPPLCGDQTIGGPCTNICHASCRPR